MNYTQAVQFVHSRLKFGSRPGLATIERITTLCASPQRGMRFIHIAGTNGKGSTSTMISSMLTAAGYKTGLYTSPYVIDFRERFQINGEMISKKELAELMTELKPLVEQLDSEGCVVTEFELITAAAFVWFRRKGCDYVVLEVGLGGRFDATNIIEPPVCSVITHIDLDHTQLLGDTYADIAFEKCGIIKEGSPVVTYPDQHPEALEVIKKVANERECELFVPEIPESSVTLSGTRLNWRNTELHLSLIGEHQAKNASVALAVADLLGIDEKAIAEGLKSTFIPARLELISTEPIVLLDGAHNPDGIAALVDALDILCEHKPTLIVGMLADKDYESALSLLASRCAHIVTLRVPNPRTLTASALAKTASRYCDDVTPCRSYSGAIRLAAQKAQGAPIIVAGSLYLASGIRPHLLKWAKTI